VSHGARFQVAAALVGAVFATAVPALAQNAPDQADFTLYSSLKAVPLGFGGAFRALADNNAAIVLNPAGIAQRKGLMAAAGDYAHHGMGGATLISASIADFKALEFLAVALEYDYTQFSPGVGVQSHVVTAAAAAPVGDILFVGLGVKGYYAEVDSPAFTNPSGADLDLGLLVKPVPVLSLGISAVNLIRGYDNANFPMQLGFGAGLTLAPHARLAIDMTRDFATPGSSFNAYFGVEAKAAEGTFLRGGFGLDQVRDNNFYSVGAALAGPNLVLNFTFSQRLNPTDETYAANVDFAF
jgi:hypothetical protein